MDFPYLCYMRYLDDILGTLLLRNNCVIIPSLGGFVANNLSAKIDAVNGVIIPPRKAINFNCNLVNNDGLIIHFLSTQHGLSYDEAQQIITAEIQQVKIDLNKGKRVSFANVGYLYSNTSGKIAFEQDRFFNLLLSSYGMGKVHFLAEEEVVKATAVESKEQEKKEAVEEIKPQTKSKEKEAPIIQFNPSVKREKPKKEEHSTMVQPVHEVVVQPKETSKKAGNSHYIFRKVAKYVAVASLATILFYSIWIPMRTDVLQSGIVYSEDFNPFNSVEEANYTPDNNSQKIDVSTIQTTNVLDAIVNNLNTNTAVFAFPLSDELFIPVKRKTTTPVVHTHITEKHAQSKQLKNRTGKYDVIAGCFSDPSNATDFIHRLRKMGYDAYQVDVKGGLHRISAGNFSTEAKASQTKSKLNKAGISTWILK